MTAKSKNYILLLIMSTCAALAQVDDAKLWLKATVEKKITPKLSATAVVSTRFGENVSQLETYYFSVGASYRLKKWMKLGVMYRHSQKREIEPYFIPRNRFNVDLSFKKKFFKRLVLEPRLRYQNQYTAYYTSEKGSIPNHYARLRTQASWDLNQKYEPYVSAELYYHLKYQQEMFNRVRYALGISYEINKHHKINIYYMHQREFNKADPERGYVTGLSYKFTF